MTKVDEEVQTELEAEVFRRMVAHLQDRTDVQNIDMMNLAGFCRNCLSNWYLEAAQNKGLELNKEESRELVYGMSYDMWKSKYQSKATPDQLKAYEQAKPKPDH